MKLFESLNRHLNLPKVIKRRDGKLVVITSEKMIQKGRIQVNGFTCYNQDKEIINQDCVRYGLYRNQESYLAIE